MARLESIMPLQWWGISAGALAVILVLVMITSNILLYRRIRKFEASYKTLQTFMSGNELEQLLEIYIHMLTDQDQKLKICNERLNKIEEKLRAAVDRVELLRFRAFDNVGGDISFAFALVNQEGSGVVLSAIHNREESRVYAKPVTKGESTYLLTDEEMEVISKAMKGQKI